MKQRLQPHCYRGRGGRATFCGVLLTYALLFVLLLFARVAQAQGRNPMATGSVSSMMLQTLLGFIGGVVGGFVTSWLKRKEVEHQLITQVQIERLKEADRWRLDWVEPFSVTVDQLWQRFEAFKRKNTNPDELHSLQGWFQSIKLVHDQGPQNELDFASWSCGVGNFAMTSLFLTSKYFGYAWKIQQPSAFAELYDTFYRGLLERISDVENSIGGEYNIWQEQQTAIGEKMVKGGIMDYETFYMAIAHKERWLLRLVDFYKDLHMKRDDIEQICLSLKHLRDYLREEPVKLTASLNSLPRLSNLLIASKPDRTSNSDN